MLVIIGGGGRTSARLAAVLHGQGHQVNLVEGRKEVLVHLHRELPTEVVFEGDALDPVVLEAAGIEGAQVLAACLPTDAENLSLCFLARERYRVPRTIATINNPNAAWLFDRRFRVDAALNQAEILAGLIQEEMSLGDMMTLAKLRRGSYSLVGETIPKGAHAAGQAIKDLPLPPRSVVAAVMRGGEILIPRGPLVLAEGDEVLAIADPEGTLELARLLGKPR